MLNRIKMDLVHSSLVLFLFSLSSFSWPPSLSAQDHVDLPVLGGEGSNSTLQIRLTRVEKSVPSDRLWRQAAEQFAQGALPTSSAMAAMQYLSLVTSQDFAAAQRLYSVEEQGSSLSSDLSRLLSGKLSPLQPLASVQVLETWSYGPFELVLLEASSHSGQSEIFSLGTRKINGHSVRSDDWGEEQAVLQLLWYLTGTRRNGSSWSPRTSPWDLSFEISSDSGGEPLRIHLEGTLHLTAPPSTPELTNQTARTFAHHVAGVAHGGDAEAFLSLWDSPDREQLIQLHGQGPRGFHGLGQAFVPQDLQDVFTAELGDAAVHYFLDPTAPEDLRALFIAQQDGEHRLIRHLHPNIEAFLMSESVRRGILRQWQQATESAQRQATTSTLEDHNPQLAPAAISQKRVTR